MFFTFRNSRFFSTILVAIFSSFVLAGNALAFSRTPPANGTGAPGHNNCLQCHRGDPGSGSLTLGFSGGLLYEAGKDYSFTVSISDPDKSRFGFSMVARGSDSSTLNIGTWSAGSDDTQAYSVNHVGHKNAPFAEGMRTFTVNWKAPETSVGDVTFYAVGNAADGTGNTLGDTVYLKELTISGPPSSNQAPSFTIANSAFDVVTGSPTIIPGISIDDPDAGGGSLTAIASVDHGILTVASSIPGRANITNNGSASVTIEGTLNEINTTFGAANGLSYQSESRYLGTDPIQLSINDNGNTGDGGAKTDSETISVTVHPRPSLSAFNESADGNIGFTVNGIPGQKYDVYYSNDLQEWHFLEQVTLQSSSAPVSDLTGTNGVRRFYRMRLTP